MGIFDFLFKRRKETKQVVEQATLSQEKLPEITEQDTTKTEQPIDDKVYEAVESLFDKFIEDIDWPEIRILHPDIKCFRLVGYYENDTLVFLNGLKHRETSYPIDISSIDKVQEIKREIIGKNFKYAVWINKKSDYYVDNDEYFDFPSFDKHTDKGAVKFYGDGRNRLIITNSLDTIKNICKKYGSSMHTNLTIAYDGKVIFNGIFNRKNFNDVFSENKDKELTL